MIDFAYESALCKHKLVTICVEIRCPIRVLTSLHASLQCATFSAAVSPKNQYPTVVMTAPFFFVAVSDVIEKSRLDLDMVEIEVGVDLLTEAGITTAYTAYSEGGNR